MTPARRRMGAALAAALLAAACAGAPGSPIADQHELGNIRPSNVVPATAPRRFVSTFEDVCLDGPEAPDAAAAALRAADYVEVPGGTGGLRSFVVDDSRPAIMLGADGGTCAVGALSRTGQTERIRALIARRFPAAAPLDPALLGPTAEEAWLVEPSGGMIVLQRIGEPGAPSQIILAHSRPAPT